MLRNLNSGRATTISLLVLFSTVSCLMQSCSKSSVPLADFTGLSYTYDEDKPAGSVKIPVSISDVSDKIVTLRFSTSDSTAVAGKDYVARNDAKLTIVPGKTSTYITIDFIQDTAVKENVCFNVYFSEPENCELKGKKLTVWIKNTDYTNLVWSDEFSGSSLDLSSWSYETGGGGWGNQELEIYTNSTDNVFTSGGFLHIVATNSGSVYNSARIKTQDKKTFTNCRVDIRAKLPEGKGIWPALWMLGNNITSAGWPACGEIDIMELLGQDPAKTYGTAHWNEGGHKSTGSFYILSAGKFSSDFHTFSLIWGPNHMEWIVDKTPYLYRSSSDLGSFPFNLPQFFIFNVAVGGLWPGSPDGTTSFPQEMVVDYIRVYQ